MKLKKRSQNKIKLKPRKRKWAKPQKHYTPGGHFIIEDKHWRELYVPCSDCKHWNESTKIYISKDKKEGWICPILNEPKLHNELVICKHFNDKWITVRRKLGIVEKVVSDDCKLKLKKRR